MKSPELRAKAEEEFVTRGRTFAEIAELLGVSQTTLAKWSKAGQWADKRRSRAVENPSASVEKMKATRAKMLESWDETPNPGEVDALFKVDTMIRRAEEGLGSPGLVLSVMERFGQFVMRTMQPADLPVISRAVAGFLDETRRTCGG